MLIEAFAIWPNKGQAKLAIAGSNLTGVDNGNALFINGGVVCRQVATAFLFQVMNRACGRPYPRPMGARAQAPGVGRSGCAQEPIRAGIVGRVAHALDRG